MSCPICSKNFLEGQELENHVEECFNNQLQQVQEDEKLARQLAGLPIEENNPPNVPSSSSSYFAHKMFSLPLVSSNSKFEREGPVKYEKQTQGPKLDFDQKLLTEATFEMLRSVLPNRYRLHDFGQWGLIYSSRRDGVSLSTFLRNADDMWPSILVVQDAAGFVFGAFVSDRWKIQKKNYYGTGETFLFKLSPSFKHFPWTQVNDYFLLVDSHSIAIGGGNKFGLWIDSDFQHGSSGQCETFWNDPLASSEMFKCLEVELYVLLV
eukprot:TRINITY_DN2924_c0_g1_i4.p1 TRINITY_DN2924_c0_g1~~TRINITY_DN2924_c0_g1_i4.p1  ORF type:complete len:265 (-),score=53.09 TRINITY_DN2924_c0_g1_i4:117-911(-)